MVGFGFGHSEACPVVEFRHLYNTTCMTENAAAGTKACIAASLHGRNVMAD
jgi:hypothetical protein